MAFYSLWACLKGGHRLWEAIFRKKVEKLGKKRIWIGALAALLIVSGGCGSKADQEALTQAEAQVQEERYEEALELFDQLEEKDVELRRVYRGMGLSYMGLADYENAITFLEKSLKEANGKVSAWEYDTNYYLAVALEKNGQRSEAIETWGNLLSLKEEPESYFERGMLYFLDGNIEKAEADFDKGVALDEKNWELPVRIYEAVHESEPELGKKFLEPLKERSAQTGEELYYKGLACLRLGDNAAAEDALKRAVEKDYSRANLILGEMFHVPENYDYGLGFYQAYLKDNPDLVEAYEELMAAQIRQQDYSGALETLGQAQGLKEGTDLQELFWYEIICYENMGDYGSARDKAAAYLEAYPEDGRAQKEYEFLQTR